MWPARRGRPGCALSFPRLEINRSCHPGQGPARQWGWPPPPWWNCVTLCSSLCQEDGVLVALVLQASADERLDLRTFGMRWCMCMRRILGPCRDWRDVSQGRSEACRSSTDRLRGDLTGAHDPEGSQDVEEGQRVVLVPPVGKQVGQYELDERLGPAPPPGGSTPRTRPDGSGGEGPRGTETVTSPGNPRGVDPGSDLGKAMLSATPSSHLSRRRSRSR